MTDNTSTNRQSNRTAQLDAIARRAGWHSWSVYERNVKNGVVSIAKNPSPGTSHAKQSKKL